MPLVTALALPPRSSAVARRFLCSRHDGSNHVEARRTKGSKECAPDPEAQNWVAWPTGHAGCRLTPHRQIVVVELFFSNHDLPFYEGLMRELGRKAALNINSTI